MNNFKVSVIVNFHNGEKYLKKCLDSIIKQNYKNIDVET
jgi:glycosyltransferase involved in cell wall biosynthesis